MTADSASENNAEQVRQLEWVPDLLRALAGQLESDELSRTFLSSVRRFVPFKLAFLYLFSANEQNLTPVAELACAVDAPPDEQDIYALAVQREKINLHDASSLAAWAALHRHPMLLSPGRAESVPTAELAVPLLSQGALYAVLLLRRDEAFTGAELRLVRNLGGVAALALANSALLQTLHAEQERAKMVTSQFISMITHELRAPLNIINGYLDLALTGVGGELNEQVREFLQRARAGSENLYMQIENLLLLARADAGLWKLNRKELDLQELFADVVEAIAFTASDAGIELIVEEAGHIPPLYADEVRLQQLVRNLLSNALRFTPADGRVTLTADVVPNTFEGVAPEQPWVLVIRVSDTGYGIAPALHSRIFERFYQVPDTPVGSKGQGLGLTIVKMIAEEHCGRVLVESEPGHGSTFTSVLPCLLDTLAT
jgi:signal transduction histidine kinase